MSGLIVRDLCAGYGPIQVLNKVSLEVPQGELTALIGPNGAGKTTLLKALSGLIPRQGEVRFGDAPLPAGASAIVQQGLVQVPEGRQLFAQMTVRENLELGAYLLARGERSARLERVYDFFPRLRERREQLAGTMSGGEQQMLAIARGLMGNPKVMLLDEPSLGLSPLLVKNIFEIIKEINRQGTTILLVEQNVYQSLRITHRAYVLETGRVVMSGAGAELLENPHVKKAFLGM